MRSPEYCDMARSGPGGAEARDVSAGSWSVRASELIDGWQRIVRLLHAHAADLHSAPISFAMLSDVGSDGCSRPEETPLDYRHFNRRDNAWISVVPGPGVASSRRP